MSSDLYSSEIDDAKFGGMFVNMNVHGYLCMTAYTRLDCNDAADFTLPPTLEGHKEAQRIIDALQEWISHTAHEICTCGEDDNVVKDKSLMHKTDCPKS